ncbi:Hypothetical predicted protein [Olea europaea subsp. europaea]|uniref:Uncharacterized protein n=1 Tax=Olea europaea subsp. europaea TaxID=158383 RepID=A0A8S0SE22_OLEEU|nr:Hypothetical predicted protein [Olea europaea subsp. europaea]
MRTNCENLEAVAGNMRFADRIETEANIKCICSVIAGSGFGLEREYQQKHGLSNGHVTETFDPETENSFSEATVKSTVQLLIKFFAGDIWNLRMKAIGLIWLQS